MHGALGESVGASMPGVQPAGGAWKSLGAQHALCAGDAWRVGGTAPWAEAPAHSGWG